MQSATIIMDLLTTPTTFPLKIDWEGKMEPSSPSDYSQQGFAEEESIFDADTYDFCNEGLFNNALIDLEDLKPDPSELLKGDVSVLPVGKLSEEDLCYDDKLKISTGESVLLGNYGPLPTVVEDEFYSFTLQPDEKAACHNNDDTAVAAAAAETLMEFDCAPGSNLELMNHLTPPQTPPQTTAFGGVVGCVLPIQTALSMHSVVPMPPQQQQQFQQLYAPMANPQQPQQLSFPDSSPSDYYIVDEYATMTQIGAGGMQQLQQLQQQQTAPLVEPLQQVPGFSFSTEGYTAQQMSEMENIVRSLQQQMEEDASSSSQSSFHEDDDDSCGFSEAGSVASSMVAHSPVYSDSAESSAYYGASGNGTRPNDADDEDWSPPKSKKLNQRNGGTVVKKRTNGAGASSTRPYVGRGTEEKKSRKKEQNKNAATRYRQKKKAEIEEILIEESKLHERNEELKIRSQDLGREISCIKKLMREFCKSKGLI